MTSRGPPTTRSRKSTHRNSLPVPDDLAMEIFTRLSAKAIARCRCACKSWSSMLRSQDFTDSFLTKSSTRPQFLFVCQDHYSNHISFSSSSSPHPQKEENSSSSYTVTANHLARFRSSHMLLGCTNGFLCYGFNPVWKGRIDPVIYNPITRQSLTLPRLKLSSKRFLGIVVSYLGYDPVSKEFKVLSMESSRVSANHQVLTLGTNKKLSWRSVHCSTPHSSSGKWISISGVLYYAAGANTSSVTSMVACFDMNVEKFSFVNFGRVMHGSTVLVDYNGKLGLLMSGDAPGDNISRASKSFELWVLRDGAEWCKHLYVLPPLWKDVVTETMGIAGIIVGTNEIVLAPFLQNSLSYVIYFNVEKNTLTKVGIQGMEASRGKRFDIYINYVENLKLL
ncbi:putative F-box protein [Raphanus sativus]|uniref:F-box protein At3g23960 n=1 Tax=Raphanus sativus TaxID=3726 RepID=A0A6J0P0B5_RAPSA|nr:putative F-box protein At3g23960 [Raphanus sativus]KAJ4893587.1 putative F-box protein [Raphanus sativus]